MMYLVTVSCQINFSSALGVEHHVQWT